MEEVSGERLKPQKTQAERNADYWVALEKWMESVRSMTLSCNMLPGMPFPLMMGGPPLGNPMGPPPPFQMPPAPPMMFAYNMPHQMPTFNVANGNIPPTEEYVEYRVPPLWKRFLAEFIDCFILFIMKLAITFIAVDFFDFVDLEKYDMALQGDDKMGYKLALEMTTEIVKLEVIHRIIVCFYEAFFLAQVSGNQAGGATPGKSFMGLRVVACTRIIQGPALDLVRVSPATTLTIAFSFARAVFKNFVIIFVFPICFPLFFNKFNRAGYDLVCRCIVVEDTRPPAMNRRQ